MKRLTLITIITTLLLLGCEKEQPKPRIKTVLKDTNVLVAELNLGRYGYSTYTYMIEGYNGHVRMEGTSECSKTFKIELGRPYSVKMEYDKDKVIPITDLCEMTARLKASNPM